MGLYGNVESFARADKSEEWNRLVVKAEGYVVSAWVNGVLTQHINMARLPELKYRPLSGWIGFQDHGAWIRVRNINVLEAPDGLGPAAWYARRAEDASQLVLERLMNPERLTVDDGTRSSVILAKSEETGEQILAELSGPGAVVEIDAPNPSGEIAFYFDGESSPRIQCSVRDLGSHLPEVSARPWSWGTFLGFERSLKIVLRGAEPGEYRIAHVAVGGQNPVRSFQDRERSIARGLLPAISYRMHQMESGRVRDDDPAPRASSKPQSIEPGAIVSLIQLEGAGTVQWWRLEAPRSVLDNDDLWLEITVDGESQPAVAAPARYLFPGLRSGKEYLNFAVTDYQGLTNRLAIPYSNGLSIAARNRGAAAISNIGFSASYSAEAKPGDTKSRMRLRGVWQPRPETESPVFSQSGRGRLVAFACEEGASMADEVELIVDGAAPAGHHPQRVAQWIMLPESNDEVFGQFYGRQSGLIWRYFMLAPIEFGSSIELRTKSGQPAGGRLALFYIAP
jgi:hypothetical protein